MQLQGRGQDREPVRVAAKSHWRLAACRNRFGGTVHQSASEPATAHRDEGGPCGVGWSTSASEY
jgi:hypothetical protein